MLALLFISVFFEAFEMREIILVISIIQFLCEMCRRCPAFFQIVGLLSLIFCNGEVMRDCVSVIALFLILPFFMVWTLKWSSEGSSHFSDFSMYIRRASNHVSCSCLDFFRLCYIGRFMLHRVFMCFLLDVKVL